MIIKIFSFCKIWKLLLFPLNMYCSWWRTWTKNKPCEYFTLAIRWDNTPHLSPGQGGHIQTVFLILLWTGSESEYKILLSINCYAGREIIMLLSFLRHNSGFCLLTSFLFLFYLTTYDGIYFQWLFRSSEILSFLFYLIYFYSKAEELL